MSEDVTMSAAEAKVLRDAYSMMDKLYNHAEKGMEFKKLAKDAGYKVPELDTIERVTKPYDEKLSATEKALKDLSERYDADKKSAKEKDEETSFMKELNETRAKYDFDDEGWEKVKKRMMDKKNPDAESAAAWVKMQEPKPKLTTNSHNFSQTKFKGSKAFAGGDDEKANKTWETMMNKPDDYFDDVVNDVFNNPENSKEFGGQF